MKMLPIVTEKVVNKVIMRTKSAKSVFSDINYWTICKQLKKVIKKSGH